MNLLWITKVGSRFRGISENGFNHKAGKALYLVEFSNPEERGDAGEWLFIILILGLG